MYRTHLTGSPSVVTNLPMLVSCLPLRAGALAAHGSAEPGRTLPMSKNLSRCASSRVGARHGPERCSPPGRVGTWSMRRSHSGLILGFCAGLSPDYRFAFTSSEFTAAANQALPAALVVDRVVRASLLPNSQGHPVRAFTARPLAASSSERSRRSSGKVSPLSPVARWRD